MSNINSLNFKNIFNKTSSNILYDKEATTQNLIRLLNTEKGTFKSDPEFGISLKKNLFSPTHVLLRDILIDEIYTQIALFIPQLKVSRKDISVLIDSDVKGKVCVKIRGVNQLDLTTNMYQINIYKENN